jgi:sortase A
MVAPALTALGIFALVLFLFKVPVIYSQLSYALSSPSSPASPSSVTPAGGVVPADSTISIPKINVHAPVEYINSVQEADVQKALQNGVVHYGTTGVPGQNGNVAIFGHSSNDWWESGNYKFVFVLLDKLTIGDKVSLDYQSVRYTYEVTGTRVVEPTAIEVLNPTSTPTLTLITCSPPGTSLKRLVVTAKQISPDPSHTTSVANAPAVNQSTNLPSGNSSWLDSLGAFWSQAFKSTGLFGSSSPTPTASPSGGQLPAIK